MMTGYKIIKDKYLRVVFGISFFVFLITATFLVSKVFRISGPIIVHFDVFKGIDVIGNGWDVFAIVVSTAMMIGLNFFLAEFIYQRERFMAYLMSFVAMLLSLLFLVSAIAIVSVNV